MEGHPGSGKTTLVSKIIKDRTKGESLSKTNLVFLVLLHVLGNDIQQQATLSIILKYFYSNDEDLSAVISDIEKTSGEGVFFVFDRLDEYHPNDSE